MNKDLQKLYIEQLFEIYKGKRYNDKLKIEHTIVGENAHKQLEFYMDSVAWWRKTVYSDIRLGRALSLTMKDIDILQERYAMLQAYKAICNEIDRTR